MRVVEAIPNDKGRRILTVWFLTPVASSWWLLILAATG
jgi:hypothetical protein